MKLLYRLFLSCYRMAIGAAAAAGDAKARRWIRGRRGWKQRMEALPPGEQRVWFHCASLGEVEQGRPVLEAWKRRYPAQKIVLTFFSPSGYEVRKNYAGADYIFYLPLDGPGSAALFVEKVNPVAALFVKYEYWYYFLEELRRRKVPVFGISSVFRPGQAVFRPYGGFFRNMLRGFTRFFVQDEASAKLLATAGIAAVTVSGDTRFDRVVEVARERTELPHLDAFAPNGEVLVAGSTWPQDESVLSALLASFPGMKLLVAPHEVSAARIDGLQQRFPGAARLSGGIPPGARVVIVDSIGL